MKIQPVFTDVIRDKQGNQAGEVRAEYHDDGTMLMYSLNLYSNINDLDKTEIKKINDKFMADLRIQLEKSIFEFLIKEEPIVKVEDKTVKNTVINKPKVEENTEIINKKVVKS